MFLTVNVNNMETILKTSIEWIAEYPDITIIDPDGWDRSNYDYSFNEEKITKEEFERRVFMSTCMINRINKAK
jgi:hypothetical protein